MTYCETCKVPAHDTCSMTAGCPCCDDTADGIIHEAGRDVWDEDICPSSPDPGGPHIVTDGETCDECGARRD